uniref:Uncharacterized protein n=1 Tax=Sphaerodactylus townsendi TaxID=933632 RepID=A0ACB8FCG0_9SAUR
MLDFLKLGQANRSGQSDLTDLLRVDPNWPSEGGASYESEMWRLFHTGESAWDAEQMEYCHAMQQMEWDMERITKALQKPPKKPPRMPQNGLPIGYLHDIFTHKVVVLKKATKNAVYV